MFEWLWGDLTRLGIYELKEHNKKYSQEELREATHLSAFDYVMKEVNMEGDQARVIIEEGEISSATKIALAYLKARYFTKADMEKLLSNVTSIDFHRFS